MGKAKNGMFGHFSGKVGPLVGYQSNGQYLIRALPQKTSRKPTLKVLANRQKQACVQAWLSPIVYFVRVGFKDYGSATGGYRAAVSYALLNAVQGEYPELYVNPELMRVSGGDLYIPENCAMVLEPGNQLRFSWDTDNGNGHEYDQAMLLAYGEDVQDTVALETAGFRHTGTDVLQLRPGAKGASYDVFIGFVAQDRSCQSHSKYLGRIVIPPVEAP